nr:MAG TPA: hypothetical protein [Caudoviricetes sp.]
MKRFDAKGRAKQRKRLQTLGLVAPKHLTVGMPPR